MPRVLVGIGADFSVFARIKNVPNINGESCGCVSFEIVEIALEKIHEKHLRGETQVNDASPVVVCEVQEYIVRAFERIVIHNGSYRSVWWHLPLELDGELCDAQVCSCGYYGVERFATKPPLLYCLLAHGSQAFFRHLIFNENQIIPKHTAVQIDALHGHCRIARRRYLHNALIVVEHDDVLGIRMRDESCRVRCSDDDELFGLCLSFEEVDEVSLRPRMKRELRFVKEDEAIRAERRALPGRVRQRHWLSGGASAARCAPPTRSPPAQRTTVSTTGSATPPRATRRATLGGEGAGDTVEPVRPRAADMVGGVARHQAAGHVLALSEKGHYLRNEPERQLFVEGQAAMLRCPRGPVSSESRPKFAMRQGSTRAWFLCWDRNRSHQLYAV